MAYSRPSWSAAEHRSYLPAFRAAVRTLLLAARFGLRHQGCRGASPCAGAVAAAALAVLPQELLHTIIGEAAYPLSAWLVA